MKDVKFEVVKKISQVKFRYQDLKKISKVDTISPPSVFIGSGLKYPAVNVGILSPLEKREDVWLYDDMKYWAKNNYQIKDVLNLREGLLNSRFVSNAKDFGGSKKFVDIAKEIAIASKPVDVEIELKNSINMGRRRDQVLTPHGFNANLRKANITSNVRVNQKLDKVMGDEIKSSEGIEMLYKNNFDEYSLSKILSVGVLGLEKNKKLVPTRWSITATDDIIGKQLLDKIRDYKWIEDFELFFGDFLGNQYMIMLFPDFFSYELFELYVPGSSWNSSSEVKGATDYEGFLGRKGYAFNTSGGYYATRLPILKYLEERKRQASILVVRLETATYWASLGVWVVRESVKKALSSGGMRFFSKNELVESVKKIGKIKYDFDYSYVFSKSKILNDVEKQRRLMEWL